MNPPQPQIRQKIFIQRREKLLSANVIPLRLADDQGCLDMVR